MNPKLPKGEQLGHSDGPPQDVRIVGPITLSRPDIADTADQPLWSVIETGALSLEFQKFDAFISDSFCKEGASPTLPTEITGRLPFPDLESYKLLKAAAELFMLTQVGVLTGEDPPRPTDFGDIPAGVLDEVFAVRDRDRLGLSGDTELSDLWDNRYLKTILNGEVEDRLKTIPYLAAVRGNLAGVQVRRDQDNDQAAVAELCNRILQQKATRPYLLELIWSYWHEEGMLVRTMEAISRRFQNRRGPGGVDPLANLEIDSLRPVNNLIWGYLQDEQHRLTVSRRAYEYDHHYGLRPRRRGGRPLRPADSRARFLGAFHNLLHKTALFFKEEDDTTMVSDGFPVLNGLREVHLLLSEGAHNQYGDLPWTARQEMLIEQWILARPEFGEFLPTRAGVVYPEPWMGRVDAMINLQGWDRPSVRHFRDLGVFGERILLSIRFGNWADVTAPDQAKNWARFWREQIQWYIHAYQAVTGVDLSADMGDVRQAETAEARFEQPDTLMRRRPSPALPRPPTRPAPGRPGAARR
jgi:hypothetical protein